MKLKGSFNIKASRQEVWDFMVDPVAIGGCAPGVGTVDVVIPNQKFQAVVSAGFGGSSATFKTEVEFTELIAPVSAKFKAHGVASNGAVDATSEMTLVDGADGTTDVKWEADVIVVGALAALASRLMDMITRRLTAEFFACMQRQVILRAAEADKPTEPEPAASLSEPTPAATQPILVASPNTPAVPELSTISSEPGSVPVGQNPAVPLQPPPPPEVKSS
jgi:uncharacterized protein